jgi:A/G-specific adenine glycosylase
VVDRFGGELPADHASLTELPGIGRSTGAAILALSSGTRLAILDGNVKRVLARYHAIEEWPGAPRAERLLWEHAESHTPATDVAAYTQAMMDLGATVCTRANPRCTECPLETGCRAHARGIEDELPAPRPKRGRPARAVTVLVVSDRSGRILLERRPEHGIWGGLYSFPELPADEGAAEWCRTRLGAEVEAQRVLPPIAHAFTHFDLTLSPLEIDLGRSPRVVMDGGRWLWHDATTAVPGGVPAPIARILSCEQKS